MCLACFEQTEPVLEFEAGGKSTLYYERISVAEESVLVFTGYPGYGLTVLAHGEPVEARLTAEELRLFARRLLDLADYTEGRPSADSPGV